MLNKLAVLASLACLVTLAYAQERPAPQDAKPVAANIGTLTGSAGRQSSPRNSLPAEAPDLLVFSGKPHERIAKRADFSLIKGPPVPLSYRDH
jgi:hypothetical protein